MVSGQHGRHFYEFGPFRLDANKHRLLRNGKPVATSPKALEALIVLVRNAGRPMERDELMQAIWLDAFVEDANLTVAISNLRKILGADHEASEYIETIPRFGYRFVAEVTERYEEPRSMIIEKRTHERTVIEEEVLSENEAGTRPARLKTGRTISRRRILTVAALLLAIAVGSFSVFRPARVRSNTADNVLGGIKILAVLPPRRIGSQADGSSLSLGIADSLITRLGGVHDLVVRPTSSIARYLDGNEDPLTTAHDLKVDAVLEGTIQDDHGRTRVTLRLLNANTGDQMWAGSFDEAEADIFKLQDAISQRVAEALAPNLNGEQKGVPRRHTPNPEAYAQYLKGNYFWMKRGREAEKSKDYLRKAIQLDPDYAEAYSTLGAAVATSSAIPSPEAEALVDRALQLDDSLAEAHATLGFIRLFHQWDWAGAEAELDRAIELDPNSAIAHHWKGVYLSIVGRLDEAKVEMHRALDLDPLSLIIMADIGQLHYFAREYDQALDYCRRALALDPDFWVAHEYLIDIYRAKGMGKESLNEVLTFENSPEAKRRLAGAYARRGIVAVFGAKLRSSLNGSEMPIVLAKWYARTGDRQHTLYWLDRASRKDDAFWTPYLSVDPLYDSLHGDPQYSEAVERMHLTPN